MCALRPAPQIGELGHLAAGPRPTQPKSPGSQAALLFQGNVNSAVANMSNELLVVLLEGADDDLTGAFFSEREWTHAWGGDEDERVVGM